MTDCQPEPELIGFSRNRLIERGGRRVKVHIVRLATDREWSLEMANDHNTSIVWDSKLGTDRDADAALLSPLSKEGFEAFLDKD